MPYLSLVFTLALVAGLVAGVLADRSPTVVLSSVLAGGWLTALAAFHRRWPRAQAAALAASTIAAGWLLGAAAVDRALNPALRVLLDQRFGGFTMDRTGDARLEEPVVIEGRLTADASPTDTGVGLRVAVERVWLGPCPEPAEGGVSLSVSGALQAASMREWTAGRTIRAPAILRRPARYLNRGLPDQERALARRGVALVGTVKSATLVEVVGRGRWWEEGAAAVRAHTRSGPRASRRARRSAGRRHRDRASHRRSRGDRSSTSSGGCRRPAPTTSLRSRAATSRFSRRWCSAAWALLGIRGRVAALSAIVVLTCYAVVASGGAIGRARHADGRAVSGRAADRSADRRRKRGRAQRRGAAARSIRSGPPTSASGSPSAPRAPFSSAPHACACRVTRWRAAVLALLVASICAELALAPVGASAFQRVTVAGLVLNFVAIPCMTLVQMAAMLLVCLRLRRAHGGSRARMAIAGAARHGRVDRQHRACSMSRRGSRGVCRPSVLVARVATTRRWRRGGGSRSRARACGAGCHASRRAGAAALFLWIIAAPAARVRQYGDGRLSPDGHRRRPGRRDARHVPQRPHAGGRHRAASRCGATFDIGDRVIGPVLRQRGLLGLDYLAVTHGDPDHIGGAPRARA